MKIHPKTIRERRRRRLLGVGAALLACALLYAVYWLLHGRYQVVTDNAFVAGNLIPVEADATGIVTQILVEESGYVKRGDLLVQLDGHRAQAALARSRGDLGRAVRGIGSEFTTRQQLCQKLAARSALLERARHDVARYRQGAPSGSVSAQVLQNAEDQMASLDAEVREAEAELRTLAAKVGGTRIADHPEVEAAKQRYVEAYLEYSRQRIRAPVSGYVAQRKAQVGDRVHPGDLLLMVVPLDHLWVEANLRETDMSRVRPGQPAEVAVDLYGERHAYRGTVEGLIPGTGSVFALLPPDNATGNFIHIVQRVPVRIALHPEDLLKQPLRPGLSTVTSIHVDEPGRDVDVSLANVAGQEYQSDVFADELAAAEREAQAIIAANRMVGDDAETASCTAPAPKRR